MTSTELKMKMTNVALGLALALTTSAASFAQAQAQAPAPAQIPPPVLSDVPVAAVQTADASNYIISTGDELQIFVWKNPELSTTTPVRPDGKITAPLVQDIQAQGKTPTQLSADLTTALSTYVREPTVTEPIRPPEMSPVILTGTPTPSPCAWTALSGPDQFSRVPIRAPWRQFRGAPASPYQPGSTMGSRRRSSADRFDPVPSQFGEGGPRSVSCSCLNLSASVTA